MEAVMAKIMNKCLISLSVVFMALSFAVAGEVHPGLKNAIDNGDYKMAKNLVEKVGVTDVYCPGSLGVKDAEKVYASILSKDSLKIRNCIIHHGIEGCDVSDTFALEYFKMSCNVKSEKYANICIGLYDYVGEKNNLDQDSLFSVWLREKRGICLNKETMENCSFFYDKIMNLSRKMEVLRLLDQKKLLRYTDFVEVDSVYYSKEKKDYQRIRVKHKIVKEPFSYEISQLYKNMFDSWNEMDNMWVKDASLLKKYVDEELEMKKIIENYKKKGDLNIHSLVGNCKISSNFDKAVQKKIGFELFSCKKLLQKYPVKCNENVDSVRTFSSTLNGTNLITYTCINGMWARNINNEKCSDAWNGKIKDKFICDSVWKSVALLDLAEMVCENGTDFQSKYVPELSYKCDNGSWIASMKDDKMIVDLRDGMFYKFKQIGDQTWMTENLNFKTNDSWCYDNEKRNCDVYGRLYTWAVAMDSAGLYSENGRGCGKGVNCSTTDPVRGICPAGWHLPSKTEWLTLYETMGKKSVAMQSKNAEIWPNATDSFGFSVLPSGVCDNFFKRFAFKDAAHFWTSSHYMEGVATKLILMSDRAESDNHDVSDGLSVRCVKD